MSQAAEGDEYSPAVRRLRLHVEELTDLCEEDMGLQRVATSNLYLLWSLLRAVSNGLLEVGEYTSDEIIRKAARQRRISFDKIADIVKMHSIYRYPSPAQELEGWAEYRARLREELDTLGAWVSELPVFAYVILTLLEYASKRIDRGSGTRSALLYEFEDHPGRS